MIDVSPHQLEVIEKLLQKHVPGHEVRAFGSRVTWTAKDYSDLDLAIVGKEKLSDRIVFSLKEAFQESDLPFRVDVLDWNAISQEFRKVIEKKYEVIQKATEVSKRGEIPKGWEECIFSEAVNVNPKRELKKGSTAKFVSMADLREFNKKIQNFTNRIFSGGSKFINGDTLMARITPCLENGKTAFVDILENGEVGCGSTEFMVLCGKDGKSTGHFVYYLAISSDIREKAIKSMTGTSGRQRVESDLFDKLAINLPTVIEQRAIAKILGDLDEKIELNNQMNKTLEATAQALFNQWFVEFDFPDKNGKPYKSSGGKIVNSEIGLIPQGWRIGQLGDHADIKNGFTFKGDDFIESGIPVLKIKNVKAGKILLDDLSYVSREVYEQNKKHIVTLGDLLITMFGNRIDGSPSTWVGKVALFSRQGTYLLNQRVSIIRMKDDAKNLIFYLSRLLSGEEYQNFFINYATSSGGQANISPDLIKKIKFIFPDDEVLGNFNRVVGKIFKKTCNNEIENDTLSMTRNSLLPKLMSGKVRISNPQGGRF